MGQIVWLASYPKSGNTWMRTLLTNYLRNAEEPADINALEGGPIAGTRFWFDEWVGIEASALDDGLIERLRPAVYRFLTAESPETLFMKVHDAWSLTNQGEPLFAADVTAGVVYLIRNPLDVAVSYAYHAGVDVDQAVTYLCDPGHVLARSDQGLANQLRQKVNSWGGHVESWLDASGLPVHLVRYEDLHRDPERVFGEVVRFCNLGFDAARVRKAVAFSSFEALRRQEQARGFYERPAKASAPFFRRGRVGGWRDDLPAPLARRLADVHGETMRRFGYLEKE